MRWCPTWMLKSEIMPRERFRPQQRTVYRFYFLSPGSYILTVTHSGFQNESCAVSIPLGPPISLNISLGIMRASTTVQVSGEAPFAQYGEWRHFDNDEPAADF